MEDKGGIEISKVFNAPRETVWKYWTEPEHVKEWWGPEGFFAPNISIDFRVGGKYIYAMHGPKGTQFDRDMYSAGDYLEIVPMEKIVVKDYFSDEKGKIIDPKEEGMDKNMPKMMDVATIFEDMPEKKTKVIIMYPRPETDAEWEAMKKSGMEDGWNSSLNKLAKAIAKTRE